MQKLLDSTEPLSSLEILKIRRMVDENENLVEISTGQVLFAMEHYARQQMLLENKHLIEENLRLLQVLKACKVPQEMIETYTYVK